MSRTGSLQQEMYSPEYPPFRRCNHHCSNRCNEPPWIAGGVVCGGEIIYVCMYARMHVYMHACKHAYAAPATSWYCILIRWFLTATSGTKPIVSAGHVYILLHQRGKWGSTIQYGYRKQRTNARVFSQTLTHGNSNNEIRQWDRRRRTEERREHGKNYSGHE